MVPGCHPRTGAPSMRSAAADAAPQQHFAAVIRSPVRSGLATLARRSTPGSVRFGKRPGRLRHHDPLRGTGMERHWRAWPRCAMNVTCLARRLPCASSSASTMRIAAGEAGGGVARGRRWVPVASAAAVRRPARSFGAWRRLCWGSLGAGPVRSGCAPGACVACAGNCCSNLQAFHSTSLRQGFPEHVERLRIKGRQGRNRSSGSPRSGPGSAAAGVDTRAGCAAGRES